jgi:hypothetical protein
MVVLPLGKRVLDIDWLGNWGEGERNYEMVGKRKAFCCCQESNSDSRVARPIV